jgi:uncharacterized protein YhjY with autotransporter beta-barrel domain
VLEATGNTTAIVNVLRAHVAQVIVANEPTPESWTVRLRNGYDWLN